MYRIARTTAVVTVMTVIFHCSLSPLTAAGATIEGTVEIPCDPSRVSQVASVRIKPVSGGAAAAVAVDSATGAFSAAGLTAGEYELLAIGADGNPVSPEPKKLVLEEGLNRVILSMQPPGCGEKKKKRPGKGDGLKDWHLTLIYFGVVGAVAFALDDDDDEQPASSFEP